MRGPDDHRPISNARNPSPKSRVPGPCFSSPFLRFFPQNPPDPHPPYLWKSFFEQFIHYNLHVINSLHFYYVDELVTANPVFFPFFNQKWRCFVPKTPFFTLFASRKFP